MTGQHALSPEVQSRYQALLGGLRGMERVLVAFSGGLDSTLLLRAASAALPGKVLAVTFQTPYTPMGELEEARETAEGFGVAHRIMALDLPEVLRENPPERCYLCKRLLFGKLLEIAATEGIAHVLDGTNVDDLGDHRPGMRAVKELGIESPLMKAGLDKAAIRELSRELELPTWQKPAGACLLTRLPHGVTVRESELRRVDQAEDYLRSLGFVAVRVRSHGDLARIELSPGEIARLAEPERRAAVHAQLTKLGYRYVALDLVGYAMGNMNEQK